MFSSNLLMFNYIFFFPSRKNPYISWVLPYCLWNSSSELPESLLLWLVFSKVLE